MTEATMAKGEFASLIGVSPGRISQYIAEGKIGADALVGEGRNARIRVDLARQQIGARRDAAQSLGNGFGTRLELDPPPQIVAPAEVQPTFPLGQGLDEQFKREKLRAIQSANRKLAEEEERRVGRFTDTADAKAQMARVAAAMLQSFEGSLPVFASAVAARFSVPQRDVLHLLRQEFRAERIKAASRHDSQAAHMPETVETIVVTDEGTLQ